MARKRRKRDHVVLTDEVIDHYFAKAAATIKEVEESLRPCFSTPASTRTLVLK